MARFSVALLALTLVGLCVPSQAQINADEPGGCSTSPTESILYLDNGLTGNGHRARICYDSEFSTAVELSCNWDTLEFGVKINRSRSSFDNPFLQGTRIQSKIGEEQFSDKAAGVCQTWDASNVMDQGFQFSGADSTVRRDITMSNGKLFYNTTVYFQELLNTKDCGAFTRKKLTELHLSCCADPQPVVAPKVLPPLHQYNNCCRIDGCAGTSNGLVTCDNVQNAMQLFVDYSSSLSSEIDFQLVSINFMGSGGASGFQLLSNPGLPLGMEMTQCPVLPPAIIGGNNIRHYAMRAACLPGQSFVLLQCQVQLCARQTKDVTITRPLCLEPTPPPAQYCLF